MLQNGLISAVPWLSLFVSVQIFSSVSDYIRARSLVSTTILRKANQLIGTLLPGTFLILAGYAGCNSTLAVIFIVIAMFFFGATYSGSGCNNLDLAPQFAGIIFGIINTFGTIPGKCFGQNASYERFLNVRQPVLPRSWNNHG